MADELNRYFGSVFTRDDTSNIPRKQAETDQVMEDIHITEKKIKDKILTES